MDLEKAARELKSSGKADALRAAARSEDARRLSAMLDPGQVERAAVSGDAEAIRSILSQVLSTDEGKRLAQRLGEAMK